VSILHIGEDDIAVGDRRRAATHTGYFEDEAQFGNTDAAGTERSQLICMGEEVGGEDVLDLVFAHRGVDGDDARDLDLECDCLVLLDLLRFLLGRDRQDESDWGSKTDRCGEQRRPGQFQHHEHSLFSCLSVMAATNKAFVAIA
jgi:hypothetical protein